MPHFVVTFSCGYFFLDSQGEFLYSPSPEKQCLITDERILGGSEFVDSLLSQANERYERGYELKARGYDLNRIAKRVAEVYAMEEHEVFSKGRQQRKVKARSLLCFWAVRELGISLTDLARELEISIPLYPFPLTYKAI